MKQFLFSVVNFWILLAAAVSYAAASKDNRLIVIDFKGMKTPFDETRQLVIHPDNSVNLQILLRYETRFNTTDGYYEVAPANGQHNWKFKNLADYNAFVPRNLRVSDRQLAELRADSKNRITFGGLIYPSGEMEHYAYGIGPSLKVLALSQNRAFAKKHSDAFFSLVDATLNEDMTVTLRLFHGQSLYKENTFLSMKIANVKELDRLLEEGRMGRERLARNGGTRIDGSTFDPESPAFFHLRYDESSQEQAFSQRTLYWRRSAGYDLNWLKDKRSHPVTDMSDCEKRLVSTLAGLPRDYSK